VLGVISAAAFNLVVFAGPILAATTMHETVSAPAAGAEAEAASLAATRRALFSIAHGLTPDGVDRQRAFNDMLARAIAEDDLPQARALISTAPALVSSEDATPLIEARVQGQSAYLAAVSVVLTESNREAAAARGLLTPPPASARIAPAGDPRDLALQAASLSSGGAADHTGFVLSGLVVAGEAAAATIGAPEQAEALRQGAALLRAARQTGRLAPSFQAEMEQRLAAAFPADAVRAALTATPGIGEADTGAAANEAFVSVLADRPALRAVAADLDAIHRLAVAAGGAGGATLLTRAQSVEDLPRIALIAEADPDAAAVIAQRIDRPERLLSAARQADARLGFSFGPLALLTICALIAVGAVAATVLQAIVRDRVRLRMAPLHPPNTPEADASAARRTHRRMAA
jgi:hypothetical protein